MFINKLQLKNFKRFTDLTVDLAPQPPKGGANQQGENPPKLVLLIGVNGSGKSCIFDAFEAANGIISNEKLIQAFEDLKTEKKKGYLSGLGLPDNDYCSKKKDVKDKNGYELIIDFDKEKSFNFHYKNTSETNILIGQTSLETNLEIGNYFYGRSSIRIVPEITKVANPNLIKEDLDRPQKYIQNDIRFINDVYRYTQNISEALREPVFQGKQADTLQIFRTFIEPLNNSLRNIFGEDKQTNIRIIEYQDSTFDNPPNLIFQKGDSKISYELLSHGEKQVIILLLNFIVRKEQYNDAIIFIDEMDCHLNTSLQRNLIEEIVNLIPDNSQFWTASHSLGFIDYARQYEKGVIIDFDSLDFDEVQVLEPKEADEFDVYDIVFGLSDTKLKTSFIDYLKHRERRMFVCEGSNQKVFSKLNFPNIEFTDKYGSNKTNKKAVIQISKNEGVFGLIDRDYLTQDEINKLKTEYERLYILDFYCFENYLYHPDNILEKYPNIEIEKYKLRLQELKNQKVDDLVTHLALSRNEYKQLENQEVLLKKMLESNDFETYYPVLDINKIDKSSLIKEFKLGSEEMLASTNWFKTKISEVLQ